jgi:hypothetical protein
MTCLLLALYLIGALGFTFASVPIYYWLFQDRPLFWEPLLLGIIMMAIWFLGTCIIALIEMRN